MPPRKSNVSTVSNGADDTNMELTPGHAKPSSKDGVSIDDLSLPKSMIARLAKGVLPPNTQIHKDALLALHKSATVFVSYIASNANELAQAGGKKTIAPQDVMASIKDAELEGFIPRLEAELKKYNETQCDKRNSYRHRVKQEKAAAVASPDALPVAADDSVLTNGDPMDTEDRPVKKLKGPEGESMRPDEDVMNDEELLEAQLMDETIDDEVEDDVVEDDDVEDDAAEDEEAPDDLEPRLVRDEALDEPDSD